MAPGEVFVQRNVGNQAAPTDLNLSACLEYGVGALQVGEGGGGGEGRGAEEQGEKGQGQRVGKGWEGQGRGSRLHMGPVIHKAAT
jgi:hypothetical protein